MLASVQDTSVAFALEACVACFLGGTSDTTSIAFAFHPFTSTSSTLYSLRPLFAETLLITQSPDSPFNAIFTVSRLSRYKGLSGNTQNSSPWEM